MSRHGKWAPAIPNILIFAPAAVVGNAVILFAFAKNKQVLKEEGLYALLALTDLLYGIAELSVGFHHYLLSAADGTTTRLRCLLAEVAPSQLVLVGSRLALCCIAVDRIRVMRDPMGTYKETWVDRKRILIKAAMVVGGGVVVMAMMMTGGFALSVANGNGTMTEQIMCHPANITHFPFNRLTMFLDLLIIAAVVIANILVVVYLRRLILKRRQLNKSSLAAKQLQRSVNGVHVLLFITLVFVCDPFIPYLFFFGFILMGGNPVASPFVHLVLVYMIRTANGVNASVNIVVYTLKHKAIRKAVLGLFGKENSVNPSNQINQIRLNIIPTDKRAG